MSDKPWMEKEILNLEDTARLKAKWCSERSVWFWGRERGIDPQVLPARYGDGLCVMALYPLNARPNYYLVMVDGRFSACSHLMPDEWYDDMLDVLYQDIEDHFGRCSCGDDCDACGDRGCSCRGRQWPEACFCVGSSWAEFDNSFREGMRRRELAQEEAPA